MPKISFLFLLLTLLGSHLLIAQDELLITKETYDYTIKSLEKYETKIELEGTNSSSSKQQISIPCSQLATIISVEAFEYNGKKWKNSSISNSETRSTLDFSSFFTGFSYLRYDIPPLCNFRLILKFEEKHTIFLSRLQKKGSLNNSLINTKKYSFHLPNDIVLTTNNGDVYLSSFTITAADFDSTGTMYYLIHPKNETAEAYFSNWFAERITPQLQLSQDLIPLELTAAFKTSDSLEFAEQCFDFVKNEIRYVDIENGINALVPRQCEKTLTNKLGDCKDMATLLTAIYRHFGFEAYTAISKTNSKSTPFEFPSIGYANHMICALKLNTEWYYLDPTEESCIFGDPSIQILGTEAFIIGHKTEYFKNVPNTVRAATSSNFSYSIDKASQLISLQLNAHGKFNHLFHYLDLNSKNPTTSIEQLFLRFTELNWQLTQVDINQTQSSLLLTTPLLNGMYSTIKNKTIYNSATFLISLNDMFLLLNSHQYPLIESKISVELNFENATAVHSRKNFPFSKRKTAQTTTIESVFQPSPTKDLFLKDSLAIKWGNFLTQPITVIYDY